MGFFDFFKKKKNVEEDKSNIDLSSLVGADFEFLIEGEIEVDSNDFDNIMTPNTMNWNKIEKDDWDYYQVGEDEYSYSFEMAGIQMTFNPEISFGKALQIANEVIENIKSTGQKPELIILIGNSPYVFEFD